MDINTVYLGDAIEVLRQFPDESIDCCVTSPPYFGLRDYGSDGQIGLEQSPEDYIAKLVEVFREVRRCLKNDGTLWVNIGDTYATGTAARRQQSKNPGVGANNENAQNSVPRVGTPGGCKTKDLIGIPWMLAFALRADGWYLRQDIIWAKPNPMPEPVTDRCVKSHEYIFLLSKSERYYFDYEAIQEEAVTQVDRRIGKRVTYDGKRKGEAGTGNRAFVSLKTKHRFGGSKYGDKMDAHYARYSGHAYSPQLVDDVVVRNKRDVWTITTKSNKEAHFATFPEDLITPCILASCKRGGVVLDPFIGSGTTGIVARNLGCCYVGIELNPDYQRLAERRIFNKAENLFNQQ